MSFWLSANSEALSVGKAEYNKLYVDVFVIRKMSGSYLSWKFAVKCS